MVVSPVRRKLERLVEQILDLRPALLQVSHLDMSHLDKSLPSF